MNTGGMTTSTSTYYVERSQREQLRICQKSSDVAFAGKLREWRPKFWLQSRRLHECLQFVDKQKNGDEDTIHLLIANFATDVPTACWLGWSKMKLTSYLQHSNAQKLLLRQRKWQIN